MDEHKFILQSYFYDLNDDINDAWEKIDDAETIKHYGNEKIAKEKMIDAKMRLDHAEEVNEMIKDYIKENNIADDVCYKYFYDLRIDQIHKLKDKIK